MSHIIHCKDKLAVLHSWNDFATTGNPEKIACTYLHFRKFCRYLAFDILRDKEKAKDMHHEVFDHILTKREEQDLSWPGKKSRKPIPTFETIEALASWIGRTTTNRCLEQLRRDKAQFIGPLPLDDMLGYLDNPSAHLDAALIWQMIISALTGKNQREVLQGRLHGKSYAAIESEHGWPEGYGRRKMYEVKETLRKLGYDPDVLF